jgi:hypothetical protein
MIGATAASLAAATIFTLVGYGDVGPDIWQFTRELVIALASYVPIAVFLHWATRRESIWWDIAWLSFLGSAISFPMKLVFLEGQNGIPAYVARITRENSWQPLIDLVSYGIGFIVIATVLTLPVVAFAIWLSQVLMKARLEKAAG